jgi:hypothetical protein
MGHHRQRNVLIVTFGKASLGGKGGHPDLIPALLCLYIHDGPRYGDLPRCHQNREGSDVPSADGHAESRY